MNRKNKFNWKLLIPLTILVFVMTLVASTASAVHDFNFQLDGDTSPVDQDPGPGSPLVDWESLYDVAGGVATPKDPLPAGFIAAGFARDFVPGESGPDRTTFATGSKDTLNITPGWQCARDNNVNDKTDVVNAFATAYVDPITGELILYFGLERYSNEGAGNVAFWILQDGTVECEAPASGPSTTDFTGNHKDGDVLIVSEFTVGGKVSTIDAYQWVGGSGGFLDTTPIASGGDCKDDETGGDPICATVNTSAFTSPWLTETKQPGNTPSNEDDVSEFFEGGISLTDLGLGGRCFNNVLADTRSSPSLTATIFDYTLFGLPICDLTVTKDGDTLSKVGDDVNYTITIENTGGVTLYKQSIVDSLFGDLTDGSNALITSSDCGASLAAGASCTIEVTRTVMEGDDDPLPNTVTVVYDSQSDLLGDEVTREDSHSVNLFQPDYEVIKTGDELSKAGDDVTYTFTINNLSSDDSPDLALVSIGDTKLGDLYAAAVAAGCDILAWDGSCTFDVAHTIPADTLEDPYDNTVTVVMSPDGFPNELERGDSHSVNLFQPDYEVIKTGDELSKAGDGVTYTFTINNLSSDDSPNLELVSISDTKLGDLSAAASAAGCDSLAWDGSCTFDVAHTIPADTLEDPYDNTVTVVMSPDGFPNELERGDSHSVNLFQPAVEVVKDGDTLSKVGDDVTYEFTIYNRSSDDSPNLILESVLDDVLGDLTAAATAAGCDELTPDDGDDTGGTDQCYFEVVYTIFEGESDPLDNTVTVLYHPFEFPNDISDSDDHSVNLFQPDYEVIKTGDELSKAGDDVTYTFTINNLSSDDSPDLALVSISDTKLGDLFAAASAAGCDSLAYNGSCTFDVAHTIPADTLEDPYDNTVTVVMSPDGFPNELERGDSHSVNLFQPSYEIACVPDREVATTGDNVCFMYTITNTSSADTPTLQLVSATWTVGNDAPVDVSGEFVTPGADELSVGEVAVVNLYRVVLTGDPSPLIATLSTVYSPAGFPNELPFDASCTITVKFGCMLSPGYWGGGSGVSKWDQFEDPIANQAGFTTTDYFGYPFVGDGVWYDYAALGGDDPTPDGQISWLDTLNLSAKGDVGRQLVFKYTAAKLNVALASELGLPVHPDLVGLLADIEASFVAQPVGTNPKGADADYQKGLLNQLNAIFAEVGEDFCPLTGDIPEYTP